MLFYFLKTANIHHLFEEVYVKRQKETKYTIPYWFASSARLDVEELGTTPSKTKRELNEPR